MTSRRGCHRVRQSVAVTVIFVVAASANRENPRRIRTAGDYELLPRRHAPSRSALSQQISACRTRNRCSPPLEGSTQRYSATSVCWEVASAQLIARTSVRQPGSCFVLFRCVWLFIELASKSSSGAVPENSRSKLDCVREYQRCVAQASA